MIETILTVAAVAAAGYIIGNVFPFGDLLARIRKGSK